MYNKRFLLVNKSIDEYVRSVQAKLSTVIVLHILFIGFLYPMFLYICIMVPATFVLFWKWIKITYDIETSQRNHLIGLINETENPHTKKLLLDELWYADLHSLGGAVWLEDRH